MMMKFVVLTALVWLIIGQIQWCDAAGIVTVQPAEVGAVPVKISKEAVPLEFWIAADEPPQPPAAIVGAIAEINRLFVK